MSDIMTNPISSYGSVNRAESSSLQKGGKAERRDSDTSQAKEAGRPQADEVALSDIALQAKEEPVFDRAKVDAIKQALQNGQYPLDSRRIAENFVAIERMIKG
jgi:negative regulator of flagellin synthesis FlgM